MTDDDEETEAEGVEESSLGCVASSARFWRGGGRDIWSLRYIYL
jgi:hypothetical protein